MKIFIIFGKNDKGVYLTYLPAPDKPKGRKPISASTSDKLERKIISFYLKLEMQEQEAEEKEKLSTLRAIYPQWLKLKGLETTATSYIRRIDDDWKAY